MFPKIHKKIEFTLENKNISNFLVRKKKNWGKNDDLHRIPKLSIQLETN